MSQSLAVFPACTTCGKLNSRAEIIECAKFTCETPRGASPPCTPCLNLDKLEDQIAQAEEFLDHLKSHRQTLRSDVNRVHDPFINQIPLEVASRIFTFCLEDGESSVDSMIKKNHRIPFVLGAVCQRWRDVALSTAVLWTFLFLKLDMVPESLGYEETLATVLRRSGQYPLRFALHRYSNDYLSSSISLCRNVITILNQHSHRWRAIDIHTPLTSISELRGNGSSTSILGQLRLVPAYRDGGWQPPRFCLKNALPSPQSVTISAMRFKSVSINWSDVTTVDIKDFFVDECLRLIQDAPRLRDCTLEIKHGGSSIPYPETRINHPSITTLEIDFAVHVLPRLLLDCVSFPSLNSLVFRCSRYSLEALTSCIRHCSPPLTHLDISYYEEVSDHSIELSALLWSTPTITHLTLSHLALTDAFFQHFRTPVRPNLGPEEQQFLPCLINFKFDFENGCYEDVPFSWRTLSGSLLSRFRDCDGFQWPLRTFSIVVTPESLNDGYMLNEEAVAEFEEVMEYGVDIQLINYYNKGSEDMIAYSKAYHQRRKAEAGLA